MLRRFINLFKQDATVAMRNYFHIVILVLVVLLTSLVNFAVPKEVKLTPTELIADLTEGKELEKFLLEDGADKDRFYNSKEALMKAVDDKSNALGILIEGNINQPKVTVIHQGTESTEILNLLDATIEKAFDTIRGTARESDHKIAYLRPKAEPIPFNKRLVPIMVITEAVMLGFLLISVMVFQEKEEGSVRAYRVSPGGTMEYILSKATVNVLLGIIYSLLLVIFTIGLDVNYLALILLIALSSFFITMLGLTISVFFRDLRGFLFVGVFVMAILGLPMGTYLNPSFAPDFITWIPSYSILFGIKEILFPTGKTDFLISLNLVLLAEGLLFLVLGYLAVNKKLMKEGK